MGKDSKKTSKTDAMRELRERACAQQAGEASAKKASRPLSTPNQAPSDGPNNQDERRTRQSSEHGGARKGAGRPSSGNDTLKVRLPASVVARLDAYANERGVTRSKAAAILVEEALDGEGV